MRRVPPLFTVMPEVPLNATPPVFANWRVPPLIVVSPEQFADESLRESWRREKGMVVLKLWSDTHRRTPIDVFIYEPFDFAAEHAAARWEEVLGTLRVPVVGYEALLGMKRVAGRPQDLADIANLAEVKKLREERQP